jgi:RNA polymerase sigma-70 factor (ECF subfamily)
MAQAASAATDQTEESLVDAARDGNDEAFRDLTEPYYRELHLHCYRMLGSFHDAEDLVQETFLRAWRSLNQFEGRARFRSWLYTIATNACLNHLERRPQQVLPRSFASPTDPEAPPSPPTSEIVSLEPYPDALLTELGGASADPLALYTFRESVELAFLTAIQVLPPRQRAVLILRDVLGWRTREVATLLESSAASVKSALQRARASLDDRFLESDGNGPATSETAVKAERSLVAKYMQAWESGDMKALAQILKQDAILTMPPTPTWFEGGEAIAAFFHSLCFAEEKKQFRLVPTRANSQPACAAYEWDAGTGAYRFSGIMVLRLHDGLIAEITGFGDSGLFETFDLPDALMSQE